MIKLTNILSEIKVNQPVNKMRAFTNILNFDEEMLASMVTFESLNDFIGEYGYDSLEEVLTDNYGINDPQPYIPLITNYYNAIKPGDVAFVKDYEPTITPISGYKNAIVVQRNIGEREPLYYYLLLKF
jgi:hypothetical protein